MVVAELGETNKVQDLGLAGVGDITIRSLENQGNDWLVILPQRVWVRPKRGLSSACCALW